jgi:hypothetical protein
LLYVCTVFAKVFLGYRDGLPRPSPQASQPLYGQVMSDWVRGVHVLHLWPYDFPLSAKEGSSTQPLATLWRPAISGVFQIAMAYSGLERLPAGNAWCWVAQRWLCGPMTYAAIKEVTALKVPTTSATR